MIEVNCSYVYLYRPNVIRNLEAYGWWFEQSPPNSSEPPPPESSRVINESSNLRDLKVMNFETVDGLRFSKVDPLRSESRLPDFFVGIF